MSPASQRCRRSYSIAVDPFEVIELPGMGLMTLSLRPCVIFAGMFSFITLSASAASADDWTRFRGENGSWINSAKNASKTWSDTENLVWKRDLPGEGSSSPIVSGDRIFVTCYSGFGSNGDNASKLVRSLVCVGANTGKTLWSKDAPAPPREDPWQGWKRPQAKRSGSQKQPHWNCVTALRRL